jgi:hypothetical protein
MNKKYERYINYIVNDLETPYFKNMGENYGLSEKEYKTVISKLFNQPISVQLSFENPLAESNKVYNKNGKPIYYEDSDGYWIKREYDTNGNEIYHEDSNGVWIKREYDTNGNVIYFEKSDGLIIDNR